MNHRRKQLIIGTILVLIIMTVSIVAVLIKVFMPSKNVMDLNQYYKAEEDEVVLILQNRLHESRGLLIGQQTYIDFDTIVKEFNHRFYWDGKENLLVYTTPTEVIKVDAGSTDYYINKSKNTLNYPIVKVEGDKVYVALEFVKLYSDIQYEQYDNPQRIIIDYQWGEYLYANVKKDTQLRYEPSIKSDILVQLKEGQKVEIYQTEDSVVEGFSKVITEDGVIGYVKTKYIKNSYYEVIESNYKAPDYTSIHKDYKINLVWHQVTNQTANNNLLYMLEGTKGVNTISPTWFSVISEDGELSSLASERYVERAHSLELEVWGLVDDFNRDVDMYKVLSTTSSREKLINNLIAYAIQYNLDGLNIDFENISLDTGVHYIEFIRELSVKCRNNGIVLSVDNYVPMEYSAYYNRREQGAVVDYVITMAYDETHGGSKTSGSVASYGFVKSGVENTLKEVPKEKVIIGIPFYTRLWKEDTQEGEVKVSSEAYGMGEAKNVLERNGVEITWDEETKQNYGEFNENGATFKMWLEDEVSLEEKLKVIHENNVAGVAAWKLGLEADYVWNLIMKYMN